MISSLFFGLCSAQVFEGHPFIVEAGVSVGGKDVKQVRALLSLAGCLLSTHIHRKSNDLSCCSR